ncbi:DUF4156 domain-containing protein [Methylococcus sp. EFPC2]|uniref:DUF4156 domain-containing protein n=1 Tax=Methylococcus sp. EFPC2 TaxID=2812648 RepID=UPI0019671085|nr:DUF4156 domain-containing protein [Methylococcus sp. EFPC2]QSA95875.1 DUF4156 domain-containing protein [Methylococcus sp. EFPC2]
MIPSPRLTLLAALVATAFLAGCTFVDLKPQGEKVRILAQQEVGRCKALGNVTVATAATVGFIARSRDNVREELLRLARNHAGAMGGDSIVAKGEVVDGEQPFGVYRCINP